MKKNVFVRYVGTDEKGGIDGKPYPLIAERIKKVKEIGRGRDIEWKGERRKG